MNGLLAELTAAADSERPREERVRDAAGIVRRARGYRWVGIYDVGDGESTLLGSDGDSPATNAHALLELQGRVVVPILGAESGIVIGTLDAYGDDENVARDDLEFLESCAAAIRPLYD